MTAGPRPSRLSRETFPTIFETRTSGCAKPLSSFGEQRIYASHKSIMFSRKSCYFFVRPNRKYLEVCVFLGRSLKAPQVRRIEPASKSKLVHFLRLTHRDEIEAPITDWLREAYEVSELLTAGARKKTATSKRNRALRRRSQAVPRRRLQQRKNDHNPA